MKSNTRFYQCQEENMDEPDEEREQWIHPEEVPGDDSDDDEEMDEM